MWRVANAADDQAIVSMFMALNAEDPGPVSVQPEQMRRTLATLREQPWRGRAMVCAIDGQVVGYALLISFWSNEFGGEACSIDELFVVPEHRGSSLATSLIESLADRRQTLWPASQPALVFEVTPQNQRAIALYRRLGFRGENLALRRPVPD